MHCVVEDAKMRLQYGPEAREWVRAHCITYVCPEVCPEDYSWSRYIINCLCRLGICSSIYYTTTSLTLLVVLLPPHIVHDAWWAWSSCTRVLPILPRVALYIVRCSVYVPCILTLFSRILILCRSFFFNTLLFLQLILPFMVIQY